MNNPGIWDERNKTWIRPSGTVKQGRRPMWKPNASHLSQSATDTAKASNQIPQNLEAFLDEHTPEIGKYWKDKEGKCLACGVKIAVQDSYCRSCEDFLIEAHESRNPIT